MMVHAKRVFFSATGSARGNLLFLTIFLAIIPAPAFAYMDPGTGSLFLQLLLGGVAGMVIALKMYWKKVKSFFKR